MTTSVAQPEARRRPLLPPEQRRPALVAAVFMFDPRVLVRLTGILFDWLLLLFDKVFDIYLPLDVT